MGECPKEPSDRTSVTVMLHRPDGTGRESTAKYGPPHYHRVPIQPLRHFVFQGKRISSSPSQPCRPHHLWTLSPIHHQEAERNAAERPEKTAEEKEGKEANVEKTVEENERNAEEKKNKGNHRGNGGEDRGKRREERGEECRKEKRNGSERRRKSGGDRGKHRGEGREQRRGNRRERDEHTGEGGGDQRNAEQKVEKNAEEERRREDMEKRRRRPGKDRGQGGKNAERRKRRR